MSNPNFDRNNGYGNSNIETFTIPNAADGSAVTPVDLGRHYAFIVVRCADVTNVAASTDTLSLFIGLTTTDSMLELEDENGEVTIIMDDTFQRVIPVAAARRVRAVLSANASGGTVVIEFMGVDASTVVS